MSISLSPASAGGEVTVKYPYTGDISTEFTFSEGGTGIDTRQFYKDDASKGRRLVVRSANLGDKTGTLHMDVMSMGNDGLDKYVLYGVSVFIPSKDSVDVVRYNQAFEVTAFSQGVDRLIQGGVNNGSEVKAAQGHATYRGRSVGLMHEKEGSETTRSIKRLEGDFRLEANFEDDMALGNIKEGMISGMTLDGIPVDGYIVFRTSNDFPDSKEPFVGSLLGVLDGHTFGGTYEGYFYHKSTSASSQPNFVGGTYAARDYGSDNIPTATKNIVGGFGGMIPKTSN